MRLAFSTGGVRRLDWSATSGAGLVAALARAESRLGLGLGLKPPASDARTFAHGPRDWMWSGQTDLSLRSKPSARRPRRRCDSFVSPRWRPARSAQRRGRGRHRLPPACGIDAVRRDAGVTRRDELGAQRAQGRWRRTESPRAVAAGDRQTVMAPAWRSAPGGNGECRCAPCAHRGAGWSDGQFRRGGQACFASAPSINRCSSAYSGSPT
ncbi:hypothetical protein SAMN05216551_104311 [Chitinasiproducens palmae]|uniref:Uncharacterized protein n=1 Tax=Chitinasiproducens palmae TaxID=1770053 RepID=A0A1H2PNK2_9BURK|nr:hypothetical protein SAMN05216551_104311 [Chitinasiproducens palmae]